MKTFNFSNLVKIEDINKVYDKNLEKIIFQHAMLQTEWLHNAYNEYKDIDKYLILIKLIHKTLSTYNNHFYKISYKKFYNNSHIEIERTSIIDLVKELNISKETLRRKLNELSNDGVIKRTLKTIKITRVASNPNLERNVVNLARLINTFCQNYIENKSISRISKEEIEKKIFDNYTQYWNLFFNFQIPYLLRWKKFYKSSENFYIFALCAFNEIINSKNFSKNEKSSIFLNFEMLHENINSVQKRFKGLSPTSISDLSGIPRATVIRKINYMAKNQYLKKEQNNLFSLNSDKNSKVFKLQGEMFKENQKELKVFVKNILNLIIN